MGKIINAIFKLRRGMSADWERVNPVLESGEPAVELDTLKLKIGNGLTPWNDLPYVAGEGSGIGDTIIMEGGIQTVAELPQEGDPALLYRVEGTQKLYAWNTKENKFDELGSNVEIPEFVDTNTDNIIIVNELPEIGEEKYLYKLSTNQKFYYWNATEATFADFVPEVEIPEYEGKENIKQIETLPEAGELDVLYRVGDEFYYYGHNNNFEKLNKDVEIPEVEVKGGIEVVDTVADLPVEGASDMLYKVLADEKVYTWNLSTSSYESIASGEIPEGSGKNNIAIYDSLTSLPEEGETDILYKVNGTQLLYMWNSLKKTYEPLGQSGGVIDTEGYNISLQNTLDSRIFVALKNDPVVLAFRYSSVDIDGMNDGPGIGTLIINDVKKATIAVPQKQNTLDITKYLSMGENNIELRVTNSDDKSKSLAYQVEVIDLSLETNFKDMAIYTAETDFQFVIIGAGTKTIHYVMDGKEIYKEEITNTNKLSHTFKIPMQTAGDHIFEVYADMTVNNMTVTSNTITLGMMFVTDSMVDTFILSNFTQPTSAQGEIITIPYMVYNPFNQTTDVNLAIIDAEGEVYFEKDISVDQTIQNWVTQDYPAGKIQLRITAKSETGTDTVKLFPMEIEASSFDLVPISTNLIMEFNANGRGNNEKNPGQWSYNGEYNATFERLAWSVADGWVEADDGETVLRLLPKSRMTIPYQPFAADKRATGFTMEFEIATHNVKDYDAVVIDCMDEGRGFKITPQSVVFKSEQSEEIIMMFKEDERVRITVTIEPQTLNRFIKLYVNGILCTVNQYKENDNFKQANPKNIVIGSDSCGIDLFRMRFYARNLTDTEQLNNFICDRSTLGERIAVKDRNEIYDISGNLTIGSLPPTIPYLVMQCEELPQYKGDKKKKKTCYFVDKLHPERSFSAEDCQFDVQGTSSAGYPIKNFKIKFGSGITYNDGRTDDGFPIREGDLISKCLCMKADYASSEQANNVMLVDYYDELIRDYFLMPPQEEDPRVRCGIAGRPVVVFWENTETGEIKFQGQYNMNNDKSNENVFGFDRDKYPHLECWEFSNNTSDRTLFKRSEWLEEKYDEEEDAMVPLWMSDFEARFPDLDDPYRDYTQFKRFCDFVVSTDRRQATNEALPEAVTYDDGKTYHTVDNEAYRLDKFKNEFANYGFITPFVFYYIYTEVFHLMDSRAKNLFLTTFDGEHWFPIPYDFDTAIGINNEGALVFEYDIEDTDKVNGENVFTGQDSTLWHNIRDAFQKERFEMYNKMRQSDKFAYDVILKKMNDHQTTWPEAIWNEDAKVKYLNVYLTEGEEYFEMCQGDKSAQRAQWLYNAFKYRDSKYRCGDSNEQSAFFRAYAPGDMTVTPYQHLWPRVDYTDSYPVSQRSKRNVENVLECPLDTASDTEIWLRSADCIASFGDLSQYKADTVKFASATKLQDLILGSSAEGYENHKLTAVELGNNRLISYLNVENCINLVNPIDLSQCYNLDTVKAKGSALNSINFPVGGQLTHLELPGTFANLTLRNQHNIEHFEIVSTDLINTLWIDDTPGLPIEDLLLNTPKLDRVRIVNTTWQVSSEAKLKQIFEKLKTCEGLDANNNNVSKAVMTGYVEIDAITDEFLEELNEYFNELIVVVDGKPRFFIRYVNGDNTLLHKYAISTGDDAIDPIVEGIIETPILDGTEDTQYVYDRWSFLPENIQGPQNIIALYRTKYRVQFLNGDNQVIYTDWIFENEGAEDPFITGKVDTPKKTSTAQYHFAYSNWVEDFSNITQPTDITSAYSEFLRDYPVYFYNDNICLQETQEYYGHYASYQGDETAIKKIIGGEESPYYEFAYWSPSLDEPIVGPTYYYAQYVFDGEIQDDWNTIAENVYNGKLDLYGYSGVKTTEITYEYKGQTFTDTVAFEIIDKNHDQLSVRDPKYNIDGEYAGLTFRGFLSVRPYMNLGNYDWNGHVTGDGGGWAKSELRTWLHSNEFIEMLPDELKNNIKSVTKYSDNGFYDYHKDDLSKKQPGQTITQDKIFIASPVELNIANSAYTMNEQGWGYTLLTNNASRDKDATYWTRSTAGNAGIHMFCIVDSDGRLSMSGSSNRNGLMIYFCI